MGGVFLSFFFFFIILLLHAQVDVFTTRLGDGKKTKPVVVRLAKLRTEFVKSHQSRHAVHPVLNAVVSANSSGRCHVWRA